MTLTTPIWANKQRRGANTATGRNCSPAALRHALLGLLALVLAGCHGLKPVELVKAPDAPMLIRQVEGGKAYVAVYDKANNKLVDFGWVEIPAGWTLHKYNWEKFITEHATTQP